MKPRSSYSRRRISVRTLGLVLLFTIIPILLSLSCSSRSGDLLPSGSPFEIIRGREKVHLLTYGKMLGLGDPRVYTAPGNRSEIFLTEVLPDYTYAPGFIWKPENIKTRPSVWTFNLRTFAVQPIRFENFQSLNPKARSDASKPASFSNLPALNLAGSEKVLLDNAVFSKGYMCCKISRDAPLSHKDLRSPEARVYVNGDKKYAIALSLSNLNIFRREQYFTGWEGFPFHSGEEGSRTVEYYSGTMHLEFFDVSAPTRSVIYLRKQFNNWQQLPSILEFIELSRLPDGKPCLVLNSSPLFPTDKQTSALIVP